MKKIISITILVLLLSVVFAAPVLATEPPGMDVEVNIGTPGDVDLDIGVDAGGDVDITVDGVDFKQTASLAQSAYNAATKPINAMWDYSYYWNVTGIGPHVEGQMNELWGVANLLLDANAQLIQGFELTSADVAGIQTALSQLGSTDSDTAATIVSMQDRDDVIWDHLMNGAEYHILLLEDRATEQDAAILALQGQVDYLNTDLEVANANGAILFNHFSYLQNQYHYYFGILGGAIIVLVIGLIWTGIHNRNRSVFVNHRQLKQTACPYPAPTRAGETIGSLTGALREMLVAPTRSALEAKPHCWQEKRD